MTLCPTDEDRVRLVDGSLSPEEAERVQAHVARCQRCREHDEVLRELIADLKAAVPALVDARAHARAVMDRLDRPVVSRPRPRRALWFGGASSAAACALIVGGYLVSRAPPAAGTWQARGAHTQPTLGRDVGVQPYAARGELRPLASGATIDDATPLTAGFRNLGSAPAFLLLFAVDARHVVHWISPRYLRLEDDPVSTGLPTTTAEHVLATTAVLEGVVPGPLRIVALITSTPAHVSDVESLGGAELTLGRLVSRLPGADVRETVVEVSATDGGTR
jgi:hypothetical protein